MRWTTATWSNSWVQSHTFRLALAATMTLHNLGFTKDAVAAQAALALGRWAANQGFLLGSLAVSRCDTWSYGVEMPTRVHLAGAMVENVT